MTPDFTRRAQLDEAMDSVGDFATYRRCLHDLDRVSGLVLAHRATLRFLDQVVRRYPGRTLSILDVACGDGSMLRRVARWAGRRGVEVRLTGLDLNPWAIEVAREFGDAGITYTVGDVFAYEPWPVADVILSAHFTHHLGDAEVAGFLRWMESHARLGWFVNDLHRHPNPYRLFGMLTRIFAWHPVTAADGLISIRRAFTVEDWERLVAGAGIGGAGVHEEFPARVTVTRIRLDG